MSSDDSLAVLEMFERNRLEALLMDFDKTWQPSALDEFAPKLASQPNQRFRDVALKELVKIDLQRSWSSGSGRILDEYLGRFPSLGTADSVSPELIVVEFEARKMASSDVALSSYQTRFPYQFDQVERMIRLESRSSRMQSSGVGRRPDQASIDTSRIDDALDTKGDGQSSPVSDLPEQFGRYRILKELGAGAMGKVYLAHDTQLDRKVALKTPSLGGHDKADLVTRFYREARAAAKLQHRNICPIFDVGEIDGRHFISMAFVRGRCLSEFIQPGKLPPARTSAILVQRLAIAMAEAHHHNVIHRDLKPANIIIDHKKQPIVMDFGLARELDAESQFTQDGTAVGTPAYMSPEQIRGDLDDVGTTADIYALGVIFYELLCGRLPFRGPIAKVVYSIVHEQPEPPSDIREGVDPDLEAICAKMMAKEHAERYQSMDEVDAALNGYLKRLNGKRKPRAASTTPAQTHADPASAQVSETGALNAFFAAQAPASRMAGGVRSSAGTASPHAPQPTSAASIQIKEQPSRVRQNNSSRSQSDAKARIQRALVATGVLLVGLSIWGVTMLLRVGDAVLQVEINDPKIEVAIQGEKLTVKDNGREITLEPQANAVLAISVAGQTFRTNETFELSKGENPAVRVTILGEQLFAKFGASELGRWSIELSDNAGGKPSPRVANSNLSPYEILTSPDYEWDEPVFIGTFDTADNLDVALTDDMTTFLGVTRNIPSLVSNPNVKNDIWMFTREPEESRWRVPINLGPNVNKPNFRDETPAMSPDGLQLVFSSDRPGGFGHTDLWMCERKSLNHPWSEAVNLGRGISTRFWDWGCHISNDGLELYYASAREGDGGGDIYFSRRDSTEDPWAPAVNCQLINSPHSEFAPKLSSDGRVMFFLSRGRPGGNGLCDIWMSTRDKIGGRWSNPVNLPNGINTKNDDVPVAVSADGSLLLFMRHGVGLMSSRRALKATSPHTR